MKWFFSLIFIAVLLFQIIPVFAEEELKVEVQLSSAPHRTVAPKSLLTSVFIVVNTGTNEDNYILEAEAPDGWQIISSLSPITLAPKENRIVPLTIFVPSTALTTYTYQLGLSATSQTDPQISDKAIVTVGVLPHARVKVIGPSIAVKASPGQSINYTFTIINLGNGKDTFEITASSAHGEKVGLSKKIIELGFGEQEQILATVHIPLDVSPGTRHCLTLRTTSILLEKGVFDQVIVYSSIRERKPKREGLYKTLPSEIIGHLSGLGTDRPLAPQGEFYTGGYLNDKYWTRVAYQGPHFEDRENYRGLEERVLFDFGSDLWDISLGDTTVNISELTALSLSEDGVRFRIEKSPISAMFFEMEKEETQFEEDILGGKITAEIGEMTELGVNFFLSDEAKTDLSASREPEQKKMLSFSAAHNLLKDLLIQAEYADGRFDDGNGAEHDNAWWINSRLKKEWLYVDAEYIRADSDYPGRRKDNEGFRGYLSYRLFKPLWLWTHKQKSHNNLKGDPEKAAEHTDRIELGTSLNVIGLPFLSLSCQKNKTESERVVLLSDSEEKALTFRSHKSFGPISISFDSKWSEKEDEITSVDYKRSEYTPRLYARWKRLSGWLGYSYNIEKDIIEEVRTITTRKEAGLQYQPSSKISSSVSFSREGTRGEDPSDILLLDINYTPWEDTSFSLEGEMRNDHEELINDWQFWLTLRKKFDLPLLFMKIRAAADGIAFIDESNNGLLDKDEKGVSKITLLANGTQAVTDKKGRFKFPSIAPGEYELDMNISSLPVGLASTLSLPYQFSLSKGEVVEVNIPLVRVCKARGIIFEDKNKNGTRDEGEEGISLVRISLISDSLISKEAFSDANGKYSFSGILPGKYTVSIDEAWLPERYILTTPYSYLIDLAPAQEIFDLDFGTVEKERPIVKTYTAPTVEIIYPEEPEKKEEPAKFRYLSLVLLIFMLLFSLLLIFLFLRNQLTRR